MNYFTECSTVEEIKSLYKTLAMQHHPDRPGGNTATMQTINAQYKAALSGKHGSTSKDDAGKERTYRYNPVTEQAIIDQVAKTIAAGVLKDAEVWIIGVWVWVKGDTRPHKDALKALGYQWNHTRLSWQWHQDTGYKPGRSKGSFDHIASKYGAQKMTQPAESLTA